MDYKTFKKNMMPLLDQKMSEIGFTRAKTSTPTYVALPHEDKRLAWVIGLDFSRHNPYFSVLMTPYWIPNHPVDQVFPRAVGYIRDLGLDGPTPGSEWNKGHSWDLKSGLLSPTERAEKCIDEVLDALKRHGLDWFAVYASPSKLLSERPSARLAADLGAFEQSRDLYRDDFGRSLTDILIGKKVNEATPYDGLRDWEKARHDTVIQGYREVCTKLGFPEHDVDRELWQAERDILAEKEKEYSEGYAANPRSRYDKGLMEYCQHRVAELDQHLTQSA